MNPQSNMEKIKQVLKDINDARERATPGEWDDKPASEEWKSNKANNAHFCRLAANKITSLTKSLEVAVEALKCNQTFHRLGGIDDCEPCKALDQVTTILEGSEGK